jgi:anaerobic selenocysteine-containing dehydrogenase
MGNETLIPTMCHGCSYGGYNCGMLAHVEDGRFTKVEGNPYLAPPK